MQPVIQSGKEIQTDTLLRQSLSSQVVENVVSRLRWISLVCAVLAIISFVLYIWFQPERFELLRRPDIMVVWAVALFVALAIGACHRFRWLSDPALLNLGILFEVLMAFALSYSETSQQISSDRTTLGVSKVALWITAMGFLVPNKPRVKLLTALLSASMWPLAYIVNLHFQDFYLLPSNRLVLWIYPPYMMALLTYIFSRRTYKLEAAAQKAQDLGSYTLVSRIGSGGMGEVWRAQHHMLAREAAIKLIRADLVAGRTEAQTETIRRRFRREAQTIAGLQSPHTVYLFDFGVAQNGNFYYVMELLDGVSLQVLVDQFGPQPAARVAHILKQVCLSLEEAHMQNLIHRDIKPSNIFICNFGIEYDFAKVLDFGLAKNVSTSDTLLTNDGVSAGTPAYMAPEIAMGEERIDGKVDVYGLGCVAYFLLTGTPVFAEKTATATALAHVQKVPDPPSLRSELDIPGALDEIVLRCLSKKPAERPGALELKRALDACDLSAWTPEAARDWWATYLPTTSSHRLARQACPAQPVSQP
ncbi:MAG: serine/threonine protein kinase [Acidobacteriota bacterium]|jgi:serine/threonine-protein kinase|nr:serine/threonine protein kinase [Acidobacteriota bacterium]